MIPWWLSAVLAIGGYFVFHWLAISEVSVDAKDPLGHMFPMLLRGVSMALQYLVPTIFAAGAIQSFIGSRKRMRLITDAAMDPATIKSMSWQEF